MKRFLTTFLLLGLFCGCSAAFADSSGSVRISVPRKIPDPQVLAVISKAYQSKGNGGSGPSSGVTRDAVTGAVIVSSTNKLENGVYNAYYSNFFQTPMTAAVLGTLEFDGQGLVTFLKENAKYMIERTPDYWTQGDAVVTDLLPSVAEKITESGPGSLCDRILKADAVVNKMMGTLDDMQRKWPMAVLLLMAVFQIAGIMYAKLAHPSLEHSLNVASIVPRFIAFALAIYFYRPIVMFIIDIGNLTLDTILPMATQIKLSSIAAESFAVGSTDQGTILSLATSMFRMLGYYVQQFLFIARDFIMAITVFLGPWCLVLGFYTTYTGTDPLHEYLSGFLQKLVSLQMWGIFGAVVLYGMGITAVMGAGDVITSIMVAARALAFMVLTSHIPSYADGVSAMALEGVLSQAGPSLKKSSMAVGKFAAGAGLGAWGAMSAIRAMTGGGSGGGSGSGSASGGGGGSHVGGSGSGSSVVGEAKLNAADIARNEEQAARMRDRMERAGVRPLDDLGGNLPGRDGPEASPERPSPRIDPSGGAAGAAAIGAGVAAGKEKVEEASRKERQDRITAAGSAALDGALQGIRDTVKAGSGGASSLLSAAADAGMGQQAQVIPSEIRTPGGKRVDVGSAGGNGAGGSSPGSPGHDPAGQARQVVGSAVDRMGPLNEAPSETVVVDGSVIYVEGASPALGGVETSVPKGNPASASIADQLREENVPSAHDILSQIGAGYNETEARERLLSTIPADSSMGASAAPLPDGIIDRENGGKQTPKMVGEIRLPDKIQYKQKPMADTTDRIKPKDSD